MQTGLHAVSWGLQRLAIGLGALVLTVFFGYALLIAFIVTGQAIASFGQ
jgi:hypothetical protein